MDLVACTRPIHEEPEVACVRLGVRVCLPFGSEIGRVVQLLSKHHDETTENKTRLGEIIETWSRLLTGKNSNRHIRPVRCVCVGVVLFGVAARSSCLWSCTACAGGGGGAEPPGGPGGRLLCGDHSEGGGHPDQNRLQLRRHVGGGRK